MTGRATHRSRASVFFDLSLPRWFDGSGPHADVVVSTRARIARNCAGRPFPAHASAAERKAVFETIGKALRGRGSRFTLVAIDTLTALDRKLLLEKGLASPELLSARDDRGVAFNTASTVTVLINEEDHLRIQALESGLCALEAWRASDAVAELLGQRCAFAYDARKGFLTSRPVNAGVGLGVSFLMHLPGLVLTKTVDAVLQGAAQMGVSARGFWNENAAVAGSFFLLSARAGAGVEEQEFLGSVSRVAEEVVRTEREARGKLCTHAKLELTDKIMRAYGILQNALTLSPAEFLNLTSALRLGLDRGLISGFTLYDLNRATLLMGSAHLQKLAGRDLDEKECSIARAELAKDILVKMKPGGKKKMAGKK